MTGLRNLYLNVGLFSFFILLGLNNYASFLDEQLQFTRVNAAYKEKKPIIVENLTSMDIALNNVNVMIKAYKYEQIVKIYVQSKSEKVWRVYKIFPFNCTSGDLGPKRKEGDYQIPEGYYHINHFNPYSNFHLSLGVSYPNKADKIKSPYAKKGGAIYMHGGCASIGCIPIENEPIKEVYILAVFAKNNGQNTIPIQIFPFDYTEEKFDSAIELYPEHKDFWTSIYEIEKKFEESMILPKVGINSKGDYYEL